MPDFKVRLVLRLLTCLILIAVGSVVCGCRSSDKTKTEKVFVQSFPVPSGAVFAGEFTTSYPDATPSVGNEYLVSGTRDEIWSFYHDLVTNNAWSIEGESRSESFSEPSTMDIKDPKHGSPVNIVIVPEFPYDPVRNTRIRIVVRVLL